MLPSEKRQALVDAVLEQIKKDVESGDLTVIEQLLKVVPSDTLISYLPEEEQKNYKV